jgi:hypothetical protein
MFVPTRRAFLFKRKTNPRVHDTLCLSLPQDSVWVRCLEWNPARFRSKNRLSIRDNVHKYNWRAVRHNFARPSPSLSQAQSVSAVGSRITTVP